MIVCASLRLSETAASGPLFSIFRRSGGFLRRSLLAERFTATGGGYNAGPRMAKEGFDSRRDFLMVCTAGAFCAARGWAAKTDHLSGGGAILRRAVVLQVLHEPGAVYCSASESCEARRAPYPLQNLSLLTTAGMPRPVSGKFFGVSAILYSAGGYLRLEHVFTAKHGSGLAPEVNDRSALPSHRKVKSGNRGHDIDANRFQSDLEKYIRLGKVAGGIS